MSLESTLEDPWWNQRAFGELEVCIAINARSRGKLIDVTGPIKGGSLLSVGIGDGIDYWETMNDTNISVDTAYGIDNDITRVHATAKYLEEKGVELSINESGDGYTGDFRRKDGRITKVDIRYGDAMDLDFEDESIDIVDAPNMVHLIEDLPAFAGELYRVLKKGGALIANTTYHEEGQTDEANQVQGKWIMKTMRNMKADGITLYKDPNRKKMRSGGRPPAEYFVNIFKAVGLLVKWKNKNEQVGPDFHDGISHDKQFHKGAYGEPLEGTPEEKDAQMVRVSRYSASAVYEVFKGLGVETIPRGYLTLVAQKPI